MPYPGLLGYNYRGKNLLSSAEKFITKFSLCLYIIPFGGDGPAIAAACPKLFFYQGVAMKVDVEFLGAAQTVTGSCTVLNVGGKRFAVDCGMHQGNKAIEARNWETKLYSPSELDFILITHAHLDHTGLLPRMVKEGFKGQIYCTPPTADFLELMLQDSAHIQEMESAYQSVLRSRKGKKEVEPLYNQDDVLKTLPFIRPVDYNHPFEPMPGVTVNYRDAGHILGSAFLEIKINQDNGKALRLVFSGDLGRPGALLVRDPEEPVGADYLFLESTYGDRDHKDEGNSLDELAEAIAYSYKNGQKVIIPAFALERTQEVLYCLNQLNRQGKLPKDIPIYLDSPLAIRVTEVFGKHVRYMDESIQEVLEDVGNLKGLNLRFTPSKEESQAINADMGPAIIISASGMCNAGRVKHHLKHNLWKPGAAVVFVGYQAMGTPGRLLVDGAASIRLYNEDVLVKAKIFTIGGFSGHAGQSQILAWVKEFADPHMQVVLLHGEEKAQETLKGLLVKQMGLNVHIPQYLEEMTLEPGLEPVHTLLPEAVAMQPRVDWDFLWQETDAKMAQLKERFANIRNRPWVDQQSAKEKLLELHSDLLNLMAQL